MVVGFEIGEEFVESPRRDLGCQDSALPFPQRARVQAPLGQPAVEIGQRHAQHRRLRPDACGDVPPVFSAVAAVEMEVVAHEAGDR